MSQGADVRRRCFFQDDQLNLGGGFKYSLFSPLFGENSHFDSMIFFRWVETTNQKPMADNFGQIQKSTTKDAHQINKQLIL